MADMDRPFRGRRPRRKVCQFCADKVQHIDYKDVPKLRKFLSEKAKFFPEESQEHAQSISVS